MTGRRRPGRLLRDIPATDPAVYGTNGSLPATITPTQRHHAALVVAGNSHDATEARLFLDALGLIERPRQ